jgi:SAM-dependent methyltransferase
VERATLSLGTELRRGRAWLREAVGTRDVRLLARLTVTGTANVTAAALDRVRPARWWCPCCGRVSSAFLWIGNRLRIARHAECAGCRARSRHRGLALAIDGLAPAGARRVLHFAPEVPVAEVLDRSLPGARVLTTDLHRTDVDRPGQDIQALDLDDDAFDLVICNHVLEHVPDDRAAARELARVTAPGGRAVISVPGDWTRSATVTFPDQAFNGHHRDYGTDVVELLRGAFGEVEVVLLADLVTPALPGDPGVRPDDRLFICTP